MRSEEFGEFFTLEEFDSPDSPGSGQNMQHNFIIRLGEARTIAGIPFVISSGFRTKEHNAKVEGVNGSAHTKGLAADIRIANSRIRFIILSALLKVGFTRIGIANNFIHVDVDTGKAPNVIWTY